MDETQERLLVYAMVNTLCAGTKADSVCFFAEAPIRRIFREKLLARVVLSAAGGQLNKTAGNQSVPRRSLFLLPGDAPACTGPSCRTRGIPACAGKGVVCLDIFAQGGRKRRPCNAGTDSSRLSRPARPRPLRPPRPLSGQSDQCNPRGAGSVRNAAGQSARTPQFP